VAWGVPPWRIGLFVPKPSHGAHCQRYAMRDLETTSVSVCRCLLLAVVIVTHLVTQSAEVCRSVPEQRRAVGVSSGIPRRLITSPVPDDADYLHDVEHRASSQLDVDHYLMDPALTGLAWLGHFDQPPSAR
jgi:hypothetical protein